MKFLAKFGLCIILLTLASALSAQRSSDAVNDVNELANAKLYALGYIGVGGSLAPGQIALANLHQRGDRAVLLRRALETGGLHAKLYIACWAATFDKELNKTIEADLLRTSGDANVTTMIGSIVSKRRVADVVRTISPECGAIAVAP